MNILLICHEYPPLGGGGGRQLANLARMYAKDHTVYFLTVGFQQSGVCQHDGYTLHRLPARRKHQAKPANSEFLSFLLEAWKAIPKIAATFRPDVAHVFFSIPEGLLLFHPLLRKLPGIISVRGADVPGHDPNRFPVLYPLIRPIVKHIWTHAWRVVCNSDDLCREVVAISPKLAVDVIPNGVDCDRFRPIDKPTSVDPLTILYVGRLIPLKRIDLVIQAVARLRDQRRRIVFRIVGTGEQEHTLRQLAASLKLQQHIRFEGTVAYEQIHTIYQHVDLYIQLSQVEGMSNSIIEAMACGLPVITTNVGGASAFMQGNGSRLDHPEVGAIARCIAAYVASPEQLHQHGAQSRRIAETYSLEHIAQRYQTLLTQCTTGENL